MAAIAHRMLLASLLFTATSLRADNSAEVHSVVSSLATSLSSGDAALAISAFSKSCPDYEKLSSDFDTLTGAYLLENQIDFTDEDFSATAATVTVKWSLTLTTRQSGFTRNRNADITLKLAREGKHWRIVSLEPAAIFDPSGN